MPQNVERKKTTVEKQTQQECPYETEFRSAPTTSAEGNWQSQTQQVIQRRPQYEQTLE